MTITVAIDNTYHSTSFYKYQWSLSHLPGTVTRARDPSGKKTDKASIFQVT